jgi:endonuclease/exonuclease/phosphatase family metal-dependent hydrolase
MNTPSFRFIVFCFALIAGGCSSGKEAARNNLVPYDTLTVGSLNLATLARRIEKDDAAQLARIVRRENLHILAVQGVTRYPQVTTRIDLVDELTARIEMYSAFGESANFSGRQTGNAVFSIYPIRSQRNTQYEGLQSNAFESAFQATIDCGLRDVVVVSTHLPEALTDADQRVCAKMLVSLKADYENNAMVVAGNLPASPNPTADFVVARSKESNSLFWFSRDGSLRLLSKKTAKTPLGTMVIARLEIFRALQP